VTGATAEVPTFTEQLQGRRDRRPCATLGARAERITLAQLLERTHEAVQAGTTADCAVCGGALSPQGERARCADCGSVFS
jgi:hypothetical protein